MSDERPQHGWLLHCMKLREFAWAAIGLLLVLAGLTVFRPLYSKVQFLEKARRIGNVQAKDGGPEWLRQIIGNRQLRVFERPTAIRISGHQLAEADFSQLARLPELTSLELSDCGVNDAAMEQIGKLKRLKSLGLSLESVTDRGLVHLRGLTELTHLSVTHGSNRAAIEVSALVNIEDLCLSGLDINQCVLPRLLPLTKLRSLSLRNTRVSERDDGLAPLSGFASLKNLDLGGTSVSSYGLVQLKGMKALEELDLSHMTMTSAGLGELAELSGLRALQLRHLRRPENFRNSDLAVLAALGNLRDLDLRGSPVSDDGVVHLAAMRNLRSLLLDETEVTPEGLSKLRASLPDCRLNQSIRLDKFVISSTKPIVP